MKIKFFSAVISVACAVTCAFGLASCGDGQTSGRDDNEDSTVQTPPEQEKPMEGLLFYLNADGESYRVKGSPLSADKEAVTVPATYNGKPVTVIGDSAFSRHAMKSISLPKSIVTIEESAFYECAELTAVTVPESVTVLNAGAFYGCKKLESIKLPEGLRIIDQQCFYGCESLSEISLPESLEVVGADAFQTCNLQYNVFENGNYLGNRNNKYLVLIGTVEMDFETFNIHESTKILAACAFTDCRELTSVIVPESVRSIGNYAFLICPEVTSISYGGTVAEWEAIEKDDYWYGELTNLTVNCSDGTLEINQAE